MPVIEITAADGHGFTAYRAEPEGEPRGGIVVIQEIFGVNHHIRRVTDDVAAAGYLAVAPALFDRQRRGVELDYDAEGVEVGVPELGPVKVVGLHQRVARRGDLLGTAEGGKTGGDEGAREGALAGAEAPGEADEVAGPEMRGEGAGEAFGGRRIG